MLLLFDWQGRSNGVAAVQVDFGEGGGGVKLFDATELVLGTERFAGAGVAEGAGEVPSGKVGHSEPVLGAFNVDGSAAVLPKLPSLVGAEQHLGGFRCRAVR